MLCSRPPGRLGGKTKIKSRLTYSKFQNFFIMTKEQQALSAKTIQEGQKQINLGTDAQGRDRAERLNQFAEVNNAGFRGEDAVTLPALSQFHEAVATRNGQATTFAAVNMSTVRNGEQMNIELGVSTLMSGNVYPTASTPVFEQNGKTYIALSAGVPRFRKFRTVRIEKNEEGKEYLNNEEPITVILKAVPCYRTVFGSYDSERGTVEVSGVSNIACDL